MIQHLRNFFHLFNRVVTQAADLCYRYSKLTVFLSTLITFFLLTQLKNLKIVFSAEDLAGEGIKSAEELRDIKNRYQDGETTLLMLQIDESYHKPLGIDELCVLRKWYSDLTLSLDELKGSVSTFDFTVTERNTERRKVLTKNILSFSCQHNAKQIYFNKQEAKDELNNSPFALAAENNHEIAFMFQLTFLPSETSRFGSFDPTLVEKVRESLNENILKRYPYLKAYWAGPADYQWYLLEGVKFSKYVNLGMAIFVPLLLRIFLGTFSSGLIYISSVLVSAIWLFGLKGFVGSNFDVLSTGLLLMLAIASIEDFMFISYEQLSSNHFLESVKKVLIPGLYTSLTTALGFISVIFSDVLAIRELGFWTAFGAMVEWFVLYIYFPCILLQFKKFKVWVSPRKAYIPQLFKYSTSKIFSKKISYLTLSVYPLAIVAFFYLKYDVSPHEIFPDDQEYNVAITKLKESKKWVGSVSLLFDKELSPTELDNIYKKLLNDSLVKTYVEKIEAPHLIEKWLEERGSLDKIDAKLYFKISEFNDVFVDDNNHQRWLLYLNSISSESVSKLKKSIDKLCGENCHLGGESIAYSELAELIPYNLLDSLFSSLILVGLIIAFVAIGVNNTSSLLPLYLSCFWGPSVVILILGSLHSTIDFWKSIFASILVGLTGDNAIHFLFASEESSLEKGIDEKGVPSILTALTMAITSLIYLGSYFSPPKAFGIILCVGFIFSQIGELWLFNSYRQHFSKSFKTLKVDN